MTSHATTTASGVTPDTAARPTPDPMHACVSTEPEPTHCNSPSDRSDTTAIRCVSIDVEEYFQIEAAHGTIGQARWVDWPSRVQRNMDLLLELFDKTNCKATFFFLGFVAEKHPDLARRCVDLGHEVASHGSMHDRLHRMTPESMRQDVLNSKHRLEDQTGQAVLGYRAPTWSITRETRWAVDVLAEAGFKYDASVFPVKHPNYGVSDAPDRPYYLQGSNGGVKLLELPPLTWRVMDRNLAVAGGGYFRLLPLSLMKRGLAQAAAQGRPAILYFHPWEFDPGMPRLPLGLTGKVRTYTGLKSAAKKLEQIIRGYDVAGGWQPIREHMDRMSGIADSTGAFTLRQQAAA
jgi:polysaccharide deacetylase family protein (PEP-CTERM system associated)